jgi:multiple sugar transport system permease protein
MAIKPFTMIPFRIFHYPAQSQPRSAFRNQARRVWAARLTLLCGVILALANGFAWGEPSPAPPTEGTARGQVRTLQVWDFPRWLEPGETVNRYAWIERQIREFEAGNPGVRVTLTKLSWKRGHEKMKIAALGGRPPDVAPGTIPLTFITEGLIAPIDPYLTDDDRADFLPAAVKAFSRQGQIFGWPWYMGGQILYANKAIFASAGAELPTGDTWTIEAFETALRSIRAYQNQARDRFALDLYYQKDETANFPFLQAYGGEWLGSDLSWQGSTPAMQQGLSWVRGLVAAGLVPPDAGGRTTQDVWTAFGIEQRSALAAFGLAYIKALREKFPMDFAVVPFPSHHGQPNGPYLGISGYYVFKQADPEQERLAMAFCRQLTGPRAQRDLIRHSQFPTRRSAADIYAGDEAMTKAWTLLQNGRSVPADQRWPQVDEEVETAIQQVLLGRGEAATALAAAGNSVRGLMAREQGSIRDDLHRPSPIGRLFMVLFPVVIVLLIITRQIHLLMIMPALVVMGIFLYYPLGQALVLAFRDYRLGEVGAYTIENFTRAWVDPKFRQACFNTVLYTIIVVPANVLTALITASLIAGLPGFWKRFFRAMYYLPGVASVVVLSMVWRWLFNTEVGLFNSVLRAIGFAPVGWLTDPDVAFGSIMLAGILRSPGGAILIYLAAMANIPTSLYESAELDGAGPYMKWRHITMPLVRGTTAFLMITGTIDALQVFAQVLMLTDGGPGYATEVVVHRVYTAAFRDFDFGLSSAMALILFVAILVATLMQRRLSGDTSESLA